jgi:hypothetical protein
VIGYATETAGLALILQPTPLALMAATIFGLLVGTLGLASGIHRDLEAGVS